jgi:hypothetical protein
MERDLVLRMHKLLMSHKRVLHVHAAEGSSVASEKVTWSSFAEDLRPMLVHDTCSPLVVLHSPLML